MAIKERKSKIPALLCIALLAAVSVMLVISVVGTLLIHNQTLQENAEGWISMVALFAGSMTSSLIAMSRAGKKRLLMAATAATVLMAGLLCAGQFLFGGIKGGVPATFTVLISGSIAAFLLSLERKHKPKYRATKLRM